MAAASDVVARNVRAKEIHVNLWRITKVGQMSPIFLFYLYFNGLPFRGRHCLVTSNFEMVAGQIRSRSLWQDWQERRKGAAADCGGRGAETLKNYSYNKVS